MSTPPINSDFLTRREVADQLGVDKRSVARLDGRELHPAKDDDGAMRYSKVEVQALLAKRSRAGASPAAALAIVLPSAAPVAARPAARSEGDIACAAYRLFDAGKNAADAVIELGITPTIAQTLYDAWVAQRGVLLIAGADRGRLRSCFPRVKSVEDLFEVIVELARARQTLDEMTFECVGCGAVKHVTLELWRRNCWVGSIWRWKCGEC